MRSPLISLILLVATSIASAEESVTPIEETLSGPVRFSIHASLLSSSDITVSNPFTQTSYANPESAAKLFSLEMSHRLVENPNFVAFGSVSAGLSYMKGSRISNRIDASEVADHANLLWLPFTAAIKTQFPIPNFAWVTPMLSVGAGVSLLSQYGHNNEIANLSWVPTFSISPALLFLGRRHPNDWFGGFSFGTTYQTSFASSQSLRVWSIDLGFHAWL